jgi:hypothetical protein
MRKGALELNDYLAAEMEFLRDEGLADENLKREVNRAKALLRIAEDIMDIQCFRTKMSRNPLYYADLESTKTGPLMKRLKRMIADRERELKEAVTCQAS